MKTNIQNNIGEKTYEALRNLVNNSWLTQIKMGNENLQYYDIMTEFCTVQLKGARQTGQSTAIARLCCELFNNAILFSLKQKQIEQLREKFLSFLEKENVTKITQNLIELNHGNSIYRFFGNLSPTYLRGVGKVEAIIIDNASFANPEQIDELKKQCYFCGDLRRKEPFFFIQVG